MVTDGTLMRLSKKDFVELLKKNLVHYVDYELATAAVKQGGIWLDVRLADEYSRYSIDNSINVPLFMVRDRAHGLDPEKKYIICCDTGRRSESAGFMLSHRGFDVYVLDGGIPGPSAEPVPVDSPVTDKLAADVANIDNFSQSAAGKTCAEGETAFVVSTAHSEELASLRTENEKLLAEMKEYQCAEARMAEQIGQLRGELCDSGEKLVSLYTRVSSDAEDMQLLQGQYASLQEQHVDVVSAHKLELEQLEEHLNESRSQADVAQEKYHQLIEEVASGKIAQQELQQLQEALTKANERVSVLETDVIRSDEAGTVLLN